MTEREYNAAEGVRRSDLWRIGESPERYKWFLDHPEPETPALVFGAAAHKLILEPDGFDEEYIVAPNVDRRTKAGKEEWERFTARVEGKQIITTDDYLTICDMADKIKTVPYAAKLLKGEHEIAFFWTDADTGEKCKVKLDCLTDVDGKLTVVDYKTAASAKTEVFNSKIFILGYHLQAFMYTEAIMQETGATERPDFIFIVQEKKAPYSVNLIRVTDDVMTAGMDVFREYIGILHQCKETGYWYGYTGPFGEPNEAFLPGWMSLGEEE